MVVKPSILVANPYALKGWVISAILLMIGLAGVRFSDGSMLLAISRGASVSDPVFAKASSQYVWDSPLKICLLRVLPARTAVIAVAFAVLAVMPLGGLFAKDQATLWAFMVAIFLTPAFRVSIQNIGVGDGLSITCLCVIAATKSPWVITAMFFVIALWHPQQSFFMGCSYVLALYCFDRKVDYAKAIAASVGLGFGAIVFFAYKASLGFAYSGRGQYMVENARLFILENIFYAPLALAPAGIWFLLLAPPSVRGRFILAAWVVVLAIVSLLTTDVTRAMTLTSLPIVLVSSELLFAQREHLDWRRYVIAAIVIALIPAYSWSGVDVFLWHDFLSDLQKWGFITGGAPVPAIQ